MYSDQEFIDKILEKIQVSGNLSLNGTGDPTMRLNTRVVFTANSAYPMCYNGVAMGYEESRAAMEMLVQNLVHQMYNFLGITFDDLVKLDMVKDVSDMQLARCLASAKDVNGRYILEDR